MKKYSENIIIMLLIMLVFSSNSSYALSQENISKDSENNTITYEVALELALNNNLNLKNAQNDLKKAEEIKEQASKNLYYTPIGYGDSASDYSAKEALKGQIQSNNAYKMAEKQIQSMEDTIAYQIRSAYDEVAKIRNKIDTMDMEVSVLTKQYNIMVIKVQNGIESKIALSDTQKDLASKKQKKKALNEQFNDAYFKLNQLLGLDKDKRYDVLIETELQTLEDFDLDKHIRGVKNEHPSLWRQNQQIELAQLDVDLYTFNIGLEPYKAKEIEVAKAKNDLQSLKESIETTITGNYNKLLQLEKEYEILKIELEKSYNLLSIMEIRYDLGMVTENDLLQLKLGIKQMQDAKIQIVINHRQLKTLVNKPWLISM